MVKTNRLNPYLKIISYFLIIISVIEVFSVLTANWNRLTEKFEPTIYTKKYSSSQYMIPNSKKPISDEDLLSYTGYRYAMGDNPILINSDHPPLGKYLIGWLTVVTGYNKFSSLIFAIGILILVFIFTFSVTNSLLLSSLCLFFFSTDSMLQNQVAYSPILDIIHVFFLMSYLLTFALYIKSKNIKYFFLLGVLLGSFASVKIYFPALVLYSVSLFYLVLKRTNVRIIIAFCIITGILSLCVYTLSYFNYFRDGYSLRNFLGTQKWIFLFWKNNAIDTPKYYGNYIPLILFNSWKVWWGNQQFIPFEQWNITWPIYHILGLFISFYFVITNFVSKNKNNIVQIASFISLWIIFCSLYLYFIPISPRYLMIMFFPIYINIILFLKYKFTRYI